MPHARCVPVRAGPVLGHITVAYIFDWGTLHFKSKLGLLNWASHVANAVAAAGVLAWIVSAARAGGRKQLAHPRHATHAAACVALSWQVERAKKCLDFSATAYIWHAVFVWWYSGAFPASPAW